MDKNKFAAAAISLILISVVAGTTIIGVVKANPSILKGLFPYISIQSPKNGTYQSEPIVLNFTVRTNDPISYNGRLPDEPSPYRYFYLLDGQDRQLSVKVDEIEEKRQETVTDQSYVSFIQHTLSGHAVISNLSEGHHNLTVFMGYVDSNGTIQSAYINPFDKPGRWYTPIHSSETTVQFSVNSSTTPSSPSTSFLSSPIQQIATELTQTATSNGDWVMYRHDAAHTGYASTSAPASSPAQLWNYTVDAGSPSSPPSPVLADGFVYIGTSDGNIYCFDAALGTKVWSFPTGSYATSSPAVADAHVYAGTADGYVYCLDAYNGTLIWNAPVRGNTDDSADAPITIVGNRIFMETGRGNVFCLDSATGQKIWNYTSGADAYGSSPAAYDGCVYVGNGDGDVFCIDASSGVKVWNYTTGGRVRSPAVADSFVYVGSADGNADCLNASDGSKIWNYTTEYNSNGPAHGYHWGNTVSDPAVAYGNIYVGSSNFLVYCLDASTGNQVWNYTTDAEVYAAPAVADGCVFAGSYDGNLYCLNATDGAEMWGYPTGIYSPTNAGGSAGSPAVAGRVVYVVGNGAIYALGASSTGQFSLPTIVIVVVVVSLVIVAVAVALAYSKSHQKKN